MIWPRWTMVPYLGLAMFQSLPAGRDPDVFPTA